MISPRDPLIRALETLRSARSCFNDTAVVLDGREA
jgi:hypothetical protein